MAKPIVSKLSSLVHFAQSLHLYSRYEIAKNLKSPLVYGEGFGSSETLKKAKADYQRQESEYKQNEPAPAVGVKLTEPVNAPYGSVIAFEEQGDDTPNTQPVVLSLEIFASTKKLADFTGKDYLLDISPESLFIIFPDLTFVVAIKALMDISWEDVRLELQDIGLLDRDIAHISGEAVSIDALRKKLKDTTSPDGVLIDLRKKMYGLAYAINESFQNEIYKYE